MRLAPVLLAFLLAASTAGAAGTCLTGVCASAEPSLFSPEASASTPGPLPTETNVSSGATEYGYRLVVAQGSTAYTWRFLLVPTVEQQVAMVEWTLDGRGGMCVVTYGECLPVMP